MLKEDHKKVKELFEEFESAEGRERGEIAKTAIQELEVHAEVLELLTLRVAHDRACFAIGLERWTARLTGAANIRSVTLFPRDLHRLTP